jgi:hypothetical protein
MMIVISSSLTTSPLISAALGCWLIFRAESAFGASQRRSGETQAGLCIAGHSFRSTRRERIVSRSDGGDYDQADRQVLDLVNDFHGV